MKGKGVGGVSGLTDFAIGYFNFFILLFFCFFVFAILGPCLWYVEVPRPSGLIGATSAGLHHSHSNAGSEPRLQPTPQLMATPDP